MGYYRCFNIFVVVLVHITLSTVRSDTSCCFSFLTYPRFDFEVTAYFTTNHIGLEWELSANVTWTPHPDYDGYDIDFVLNSIKKESASECSRRSMSCVSKDEGYNHWREFKQLPEYGSTYRVTLYISEDVDEIRGKYITDIVSSPDCIDETASVEFCRNQTVGYIGKPFNITSDVQRINKTNDVAVSITWRQPIHIHPDIILYRYRIAWNDDAGSSNIMTLTNISYVPGEYITTQLETPLQEGNNYTLTISPVVGFDSDTTSFRGTSNKYMFNTYLPEVQAVTSSPIIEPTLEYVIAVAVGLPLTALLVLTITVALYRNAFKGTNKPDEFFPDGTDSIGCPEYQMLRDNITWEKRVLLGQGYYGEVYKCKVQKDGISYDAAVKLPKQMAKPKEIDDFVDEIKQIIKLGRHENIVLFLGYNIDSTPLMLINEFVKYGDMYHFLRRAATKTEQDPIYKLELINQLDIAKQVSNGMAYMTSKSMFHGDLAARNILIDEGLKVKITDFGLSIDIYGRNYHRLESLELPWRWLAIEALDDGHKVSSKSDVWSFGIVLTEIFRFCDPCPYENIKKSTELIDFLKSEKKNRMDKPRGCPNEMYQIMLRCWSEDPSQRPTFEQLCSEIQEILDSNKMDIPKTNTCDLSKEHFGSHSSLNTTSLSCSREFIRQPGSDENATHSYKENKHSGSHSSANTMSISGGREFIREPGSDESATDSYKTNGLSNQDKIDESAVYYQKPTENVVHAFIVNEIDGEGPDYANIKRIGLSEEAASESGDFLISESHKNEHNNGDCENVNTGFEESTLESTIISP
ncbi:uncharacterized protein [Antedon mediterranea]|uniref:uncharacterized protein n=1 Tax=Antedon mediterranea TaxID=105859 RepID=UPI003AF61CCF